MSSRRAIGFVELAGPLQQVNQRESRFDDDVAGGVVGRAGARAYQHILQRRDRARRIAHSLLCLRQKKRDLRVVGVGARILAQLTDLGIDAAMPLTREQAEQPHPGLAPQRRVLVVAGEPPVRQGEHGVPFGDGLA